MNIDALERKLALSSDSQYSSIIELIIIAVRDYPLSGLDDTDDYFEEVRRLLNTEDISREPLRKYIELNQGNDDDDMVWKIVSLTSLLEAFDLMKLHGVSFDETIYKMKEI